MLAEQVGLVFPHQGGSMMAAANQHFRDGLGLKARIWLKQRKDCKCTSLQVWY